MMMKNDLKSFTMTCVRKQNRRAACMDVKSALDKQLVVWDIFICEKSS